VTHTLKTVLHYKAELMIVSYIMAERIAFLTCREPVNERVGHYDRWKGIEGLLEAFRFL